MNTELSTKPVRSRVPDVIDKNAGVRNTVLEWFRSKGWTPFEFQCKTWDAYLAGKSGLIHAPTGIGKTYAAWFGTLMEWVMEAQTQPGMPLAEDRPPLRVLWVTPLRALAKDLQAALLQFVLD
ncbi:MAG: DEAD/DEAH box helicase, partial [Desulfobacterales bacterium]